MRDRAAIAAAALLCASALAADGGRLRASEEAGPFRISVYTRPEPLGAGPAEVSVLVQDRHTDEAILDADVTLVVVGPGSEGGERPMTARRDGRNRLFGSARVDFVQGTSIVDVRVRRGSEHGRIRLALDAAAPLAGPPAVWPYLAFPPVAVVLFAANRTLRRRQRLARRPV